jgi:hypothetical protein
VIRNLAKNGIEIVTAAKLPFVEETMKDSQAAFEEAKNENEVHPDNGKQETSQGGTAESGCCVSRAAHCLG